jgi:hypothetical protein
MRKLTLLFAICTLSIAFTNCKKNGLTPEIPTSVSEAGISPKDSSIKVKRGIVMPDSLSKK